MGPEHSLLHDLGRVRYTSVSDQEALEAFRLLSRLEGIIPALESAHAVSAARKLARELGPKGVMIVNVSGRGDKDVEQVRAMLAPAPKKAAPKRARRASPKKK